MKIGIVYDDCFKKHTARYDHPECPERLDSVIEGLKRAGVWSRATHLSPVEADRTLLTTVHDEAYIDLLLEKIDGRSGNLDADTFFSQGSKEAALKAAGGAADLALKVHARELDWGFAAVRPPGHHAESNRACGFCMINNIAVAAGTLLKTQSAERVAIVDWDVHHGNGTQEQFYDNPNVLYISLHQWPHFPGSGLSNEIGKGEGKGRTINFPFPAGLRDGDYLFAFRNVILPALAEFKPEHILVSAGYDAHERDFLAGMNLSTNAFAVMTQLLQAAAAEHCGGRISFYLEGGYHLDALADSVAATCNGMAPTSPILEPDDPSPQGIQIVNQTVSQLAPYWKTDFSALQ
ncbi:MAG: histone deacetylase [Deltaproteobacteria bacterium]|nr:histone deacetylase [Deltaproteobacteria bacterium]MBN2674358.1 histone deacetylase [Deltaproteobacteria bacterium]